MSKSDLNSLEAFRINFQSIYYNQSNSLALSLNLLEFAYYQFKSTYLFQNKQELKLICDSKDGSFVTPKRIKGFLMNSLVDNIKISVCFENLLKAHLLSNYYLIHELDRNIFPEMSKIQKERPIMFLEFLEHAEWKNDDKIRSKDSSIKREFAESKARH